MTFRRPSGFLTLIADTVYITQVRDVEAGLGRLSSRMNAINVTSTHGHELTPVNTSRRAVRLLVVWSLLSHPKCKRCDEPTSRACAAAWLHQRRTLPDCLPLKDDTALADRRAALEAML